jgi:hypothetical protein
VYNSILRIALGIALILVFKIAIASEIDVCSAKQKGRQAIGETVSFNGSITSDGMHSTVIIPDKCPNTGFLMAPDEEVNSPLMIIRQSVMKIGSPGTVDKRISVEVDGEITSLANHRLGLKITKLRRLTLTYPSS